MHATTNTARGEATITIGGQPYKIRISLNVLRDWSKLTGKGPSEVASQLEENYPDTASTLVSCAVLRYVPAEARPATFGPDEAADLIEALTPADAAELADAIIEAVTPDPLLAALRQQVAAKAAQRQAQLTSGATTSTLPTES